MNITVQYYAILREQRGLSDEEVETAAVTAGELYSTLKHEHGFSLGEDCLRVAINDEFTGWNHPLQDDDRVTFIPPVAGG
jgi:molybdopterin synthase sulfur carrier subunit